MHNPIVAIIAAAVAGWVFGAIWYGVLGKAWQRARGLVSARTRLGRDSVIAQG